MKELASIGTMPLEELREQVLDGLVQRYSQEIVTLEEFERRTSLATKAVTKGELLSAIVDLPEGEDRSPAPRSGQGGWKVSDELTGKVGKVLCVFGGSSRKGVWRAQEQMQTLCVFGGAELDFSKAIIPPGGLTVSCLAVFGGVDITVPPDVRVEVSGMGVFGGFDHRRTEAADSAPLIRIEGLAVFGGVSVKVRG
jgi:hypothetical protein